MSFDKPTAGKIKSLLIDKHKEDIIVTECKMGSAGSRILDAWVMKKTWSPKTTIGYEIKVYRGDFLQDDKWTDYLDTCHQFYFVCPWGLIQKEEIPQDVGLMWCSKNGSRLYTKRKSVHRKEDVDNDLLFYILMNRVKITKSNFGYSQYRQNERKYWELWLKHKNIDGEFGRMVSKSIRQTVQDKINEVERENQKLNRENQDLQDIKNQLKELKEAGIEAWTLKNVLKNGIGSLISEKLKYLRNDMNNLKKKIETVDRDIEHHVSEYENPELVEAQCPD